MKEKILKIFFEESYELVPVDETINEKELEIKNQVNEIRVVCNFLKTVTMILCVWYMAIVLADFIFPTGPLDYELVHDVVFAFVLMLYSNLLINYFYIVEMLKISTKVIDKKVINKTKIIFIVSILLLILGLHNIVYEVICILNKEKIIYLITLLIIVEIIVTSFVVSMKVINNLFKQIENLRQETDGIV